MIAVVAAADVARVMAVLTAEGETVTEIGTIEPSPTAEADCIVENAESLWRS